MVGDKITLHRVDELPEWALENEEINFMGNNTIEFTGFIEQQVGSFETGVIVLGIIALFLLLIFIYLPIISIFYRGRKKTITITNKK